jgi:hypothetical protein
LLLFAGTLPSVIGTSAPIWVMAAAGAYAVVRYQRRQAFFPLSFLGFSFLAVCAGLHFRNHYFVLLLPAVSVLAGAIVAIPRPRGTTPVLAPTLVISAFALALLLGHNFLFRMTPPARSMAQIPFRKPSNSHTTSANIREATRVSLFSAPSPKSIFTPGGVPPPDISMRTGW